MAKPIAKLLLDRDALFRVGQGQIVILFKAKLSAIAHLCCVEKVRLKKGKERAMLNRHPWLFSGALESLPHGEEGDIVEVVDFKSSRLGFGFFSPSSQISVRLFEFGTADVFDFPYWQAKITAAYQIRKNYVASAQTNCYRLINAEGDFFPGLIADVYDGVVVLQVLIKATEKLMPHIVEAFASLGFENIYLKTKQVSERLESVESAGWVAGGSQTTVLVRENGLRFWVDFAKGQKTGFFLDQRDNRQLLALYCRNKNVLNTFSFSGGFSVYALAADAAKVVSVDSSQHALELCEQNVRENFAKPVAHQSLCQDCFEFLREDNRDFDVIVLDPPAFAKTAKSVPNAARGYKDLNLLAFKKVNAEGLVFTFSCSQKIDRDMFRKIVFAAAADSGRNVRILHQLSQPLDHPVNIFHPENEYLKGLVLHVQ